MATSCRLTSKIPLVAMMLLSSYLLRCNSNKISDLRRAQNVGISGRFIVQRSALEDVLRDLELEGRVQLLTSPQHCSRSGEVVVSIQTQDQPVQSPITFAIVGLPVVNRAGKHAVIFLAYYTDATKPCAIPYLTSIDAVRHIDSIETRDGHVILRDGDDVMNITVQHDEECAKNKTISDDLDTIYGNDVRLTNYPAAFNWGCDELGDDVSYCSALEPFMGDIVDTNGDVCTTMSTTKSRRCRADMNIASMSGIFQSTVPFLAETVPIQSFEAGWMEREHGIGVVYPCF